MDVQTLALDLDSKIEYDLIVSNPPYIPTPDRHTMEPEVCVVCGVWCVTWYDIQCTAIATCRGLNATSFLACGVWCVHCAVFVLAPLSVCDTSKRT